MPKDFYPVSFEGGLNNDANPRDLNDNELQEANDVVVDKVGKIKLMGSISNVTGSSGMSSIDDIERGYGLFRFDSDYPFTSTTTSNNFFALAGYNSDDDFCADIYDSNFRYYSSTDIGTSLITLNSVNNDGFEPVFYYIDGGLRICDGSFSTNSSNYWFGHVERTHFNGLTPGGAADAYSGYYAYANTLATPTRGLVGEMTGVATGGDANTLTDTGAFAGWTAAQLDGLGYLAVNITDDEAVTINTRTSDDEVETDALTGTWNGDTYGIYPTAGTGFNYDTTATGSGGTWTAGTYMFASTFIYDNNQESLPWILSGTITLTAGQYFGLNHIMCTSPFNPRITGGRIYTRIQGSNDEWVLLWDIDLNKGVRISLDSDYLSWDLAAGYTGTNNYIRQGTTPIPVNPNVETYQSLNGFDSGKVTTLIADYKTACVANRMAYIGNVEYNGIKYEDAIFKSYPNRFDTFTLDRRLEIVRGDGESIIKLEEFADRILVFKEINLYILNVSQEIEFLEAKFDFRGVKYPYQTTKTEYGIAWANEYGVYLYDGQQVHDLLLDRSNPMRRKINIASWQSHWDSTGSISYDSSEKRLYLWANIASSTNENVYVYSLITGCWTVGINKLTNAAYKYSNFDIDWNGGMIVHDNVDNLMREWSNTPVSTTSVSVVTGDKTLGSVGADKRFYGANITHKNAGTSANASYSLNQSGTYTSFGALTNYSTYTSEEERVDSVNNCKSVNIKISGNPSATFEVDDISFLFRKKGNR